MIPFALKSLIKYHLPALLMLLASLANAQPDTLIVYEYIYITDTVWLEAEPVRDTLVIEQLSSIESATLFFDSVKKKAELVIISGGASATIPIHRIIMGENNEQKEMKQKGIFTLLLLSIQSVLPAQPTIDCYTGTTGHWFQHNVSTISNPMELGAHMGLAVNLPFRNPIWAFSVGMEMHSIYPIADYRQRKPVDASLSYIERDFAQIQTNAILNELNTGLFNKPFNQLSVPFKINYQKGKWKPFLGIAYGFTRFIYYPEIENPRMAQRRRNPPTAFHDFSLLAGTRYSITQKVGLDFSLNKGLVGKTNAYEDYLPVTIGIDEYSFQSANAMLSLVITL
ncbi:MAG: hypothetical protein JXR22_14010 [Prolixibacteraceae bacterium]|nr:hypothetical protein [Prolixibacteraceae bacterium]